MLTTRTGGSTVIKAGQAGPVLKRLSTVDLADHLSEARGIVEAATNRAAIMLSDARIEGERNAAEAEKKARAAGYEAGYAEGERAGHKSAFEESKREFERQHAAIVKQMQQAIAEIDVMKEGLRIAAEKDLLDFSVTLATKMTCHIGRSFREAAIENVKRAIRLIGSKTDLTIRVNPQDFASMETYAAAALRSAAASPAVKIVSDDSMAPGGCIVETDRGRVDATLETQIDELTGLLLGEVNALGGSSTDKDSKSEFDA